MPLFVGFRDLYRHMSLCQASATLTQILHLLQEEEVLRGQELENAVSDSDYAKAIQLAFELRRPHRLLDLFSQLARYYFLIRMKSAALNY